MDVAQQGALAIAVATGLIIFMDWVPTRLNRNITGMTVKERIPSTAIHGLLGVMFVTAGLMGWTWVVFVGALWYTAVLAQGLRNWWAPYLLGVGSAEISPENYRENYSGNLRFLPRIGGHLMVPDVQHVLIHLSLLVAAVLSWRSFVDLV